MNFIYKRERDLSFHKLIIRAKSFSIGLKELYFLNSRIRQSCKAVVVFK